MTERKRDEKMKNEQYGRTYGEITCSETKTESLNKEIYVKKMILVPLNKFKCLT
jgi:hypothetical protein